MINKESIVYISGPMTGYDMLNYHSFFGCAEWLRGKYDCEILNPATFGAKLPYAKNMIIDLACVSVSTVILLIKGWEESNGALLELQCAVENGLEILEVKNGKIKKVAKTKIKKILSKRQN